MSVQVVSQIDLVRKERHARYLYGQKVRKWAPIIVQLMNRRRSSIMCIQRSLHKYLYMSGEDSEWLCDRNTPGIYLLRFRLTIANISIEHMGISQTDFDDMEMEINPVVVVVDARTTSSNGLVWAREMPYKLTGKQIYRLTRAQKKVMNVRYLQDIEYSKTLSYDKAAGLA